MSTPASSSSASSSDSPSAAIPFTFGENGCSQLTAFPLEPICEHPEIDGTEPLTLNVPAPVFAIPVPPNECACFAFTGEETRVSLDSCSTAGGYATVNLEITQSGDDCCAGKYKITPAVDIKLPCCVLPDVVQAPQRITLQNGSYIDLIVKRISCMPEIEFQSHIENIPVTPAFCMCDTEVPVNVKYKDTKGVTRTTATKKFDVAVKRCVDTYGNYTSCYTLDFDTITFDVTSFSFSNGGDVNLADGVLRIDGTPSYDDVDTYFGGGYGDRVGNDSDYYYNDPFCRGTTMRGKSGSDAPSVGSSYHVPTAEIHPKFVVVRDAKTVNAVVLQQGAQKWEGGRTEDTVTTSSLTHARIMEMEISGDDGDVGDPSGDDTGDAGTATEEYTTTWESDGNLNIVWPTGVQWHTRGLALTLTEFEFKSSGVLSYAEEKDRAVLVSPCPAVKLVSSGGVPAESSDDASGLAVMTWDNTKVSNGLRVNDGRGLRIYNATKTTETGANVVNSEKGKLEIYKSTRDFAFSGGRLILNDSAKDLNTGTNITQKNCFDSNGAIVGFNRDCDYTIPVVVFDTYSGTYPIWDSGNGAGVRPNNITTIESNYSAADTAISAYTGDSKNLLSALLGLIGQIKVILGTLHGVNLHITRSGIVVGADSSGTFSDVTRVASYNDDLIDS